MITVSLCDPQPVIHEGLKAVLAGQEDIQLLDACFELEAAAPMIAVRRPDILIVDRSFGLHPALKLVAHLQQKAPETKVVIWAANVSDVECFKALQAGARGIMKKTIAPRALFHCLRSVAKDELWTENLYELGDEPLAHPRSRPLTPREQQVASLVSKGLKNREIAETLGIATGTVKIHLMHIFEKTGIRDRFELALHGLRAATADDSRAVETEPAFRI